MRQGRLKMKEPMVMSLNTFSNNGKVTAYITLPLNSVWDFRIESGNIFLDRGNVSLTLPKEDFPDRYYKVLEQKGEEDINETSDI